MSNKKELPKVDYIYDPDFWEITYTWKERDSIAEEASYHWTIFPGKMMEFATLIQGPPVWVIVDSDCRIKWFASKEKALKFAEKIKETEGEKGKL